MTNPSFFLADGVYDPVIRPVAITQNRLGLNNQDGDCASVSLSLMAWNQYQLDPQLIFLVENNKIMIRLNS